MSEADIAAFRQKLDVIAEQSKGGTDLLYAPQFAALLQEFDAYCAANLGELGLDDVSIEYERLLDAMVDDAFDRLSARAIEGDLEALDTIAHLAANASEAEVVLQEYVLHTYHLTWVSDGSLTGTIVDMLRILTSYYRFDTDSVEAAYWQHVLTRAEHGVGWAVDALAGEFVRQLGYAEQPRWHNDPESLLRAAQALAAAKLGRTTRTRTRR
jgi:hypothetical protein